MYSAVTKILHIGWTTCSINQHASIIFFPGICLEIHSHMIMHAQCLLTWHTLFIISNPMLSLGGESSLYNIEHMVPCDDPCPCWGKQTNKQTTKKKNTTEEHIGSLHKGTTYSNNHILVTLGTRCVFLTSQTLLLISVGNVLAKLIQTIVSEVINEKFYFPIFELDSDLF